MTVILLRAHRLRKCVKLSPGFESFENGIPQARKLKKSLYGLKRAPHTRNSTIEKRFKELGCTSLILDSCVCKKGNGNPYSMRTLYVNDLIKGVSEGS